MRSLILFVQICVCKNGKKHMMCFLENLSHGWRIFSTIRWFGYKHELNVVWWAVIFILQVIYHIGGHTCKQECPPLAKTPFGGSKPPPYINSNVKHHCKINIWVNIRSLILFVQICVSKNGKKHTMCFLENLSHGWRIFSTIRWFGCKHELNVVWRAVIFILREKHLRGGHTCKQECPH